MRQIRDDSPIISFWRLLFVRMRLEAPRATHIVKARSHGWDRRFDLAENPPSGDMSAKDANGNPLEFGQLVAPGVDGVDHDHFFSFRLDLDVDGTNNSFMADKLVPYQLPKDNPSPRRVIWAMQPTMIKTEGEAMQDIDLHHPAMWRFVNHDVHDPYGYSTSFEIMPGETAASLLPDTEWPQRRAGFSSHQLWVKIGRAHV